MSKSELETLFLDNWNMYSGMQAPDREYHFARVKIGDAPHPPAKKGMRRRLADAGLRDWVFDFCFPCSMIAVEIDGGQWKSHGGRHNTDEDREKINMAVALGWRVLRFSGSMLKDNPMGVIEVIKKTLCHMGDEDD